MAIQQLKRELLTYSRDLEFFEIQTLQAATGQSAGNFHNVILKELLDNALDACEAAGVAPKIGIEITSDAECYHFSILDNGDGLSREAIERIMDISSYTSDKAAYKAPLRGAQGNALKTLMGIPVALSGGSVCIPLVIESRGVAYSIHVMPDQVLQKVDIGIEEEPVDHNFTVIKTWIPVDYAFQEGNSVDYWSTIIQRYACFNPHARFSFVGDDSYYPHDDVYEPKSPEYTKFLPTEPTSPWWYTEDDMRKLVYGFISNDLDKTLREFLMEFKGLSRATSKITALFPGAKRLSDLSRSNGDLSHLLAAMQTHATEPKPSALRCLGKEHFQYFLGDDGFLYKKIASSYKHRGARIPYIIEAAASKYGEEYSDLLVGVNHSVTYSNPFNTGVDFKVQKGNKEWSGWGLNGLLNDLKVGSYDDFRIVLHLICPNIQYTDKSKSKFDIKPFVDDVSEAIYQVCKDHYKEKKAQENQHKAKVRKIEENEERRRSEKIHQNEAVFAVLADAADQASGGGKLPYSARTLYYQVRPRIQKYTTKELDYNYFTPQLLTEYQDTYGALPDLYYEPSGKMVEPHTEDEVPLGTREVNAYHIPEHRYNKILYVEKKGLLPVIQAARIPERYDLALMAGQGYANRAAKSLIDEAAKALSGMSGDNTDIQVCVIHDCDPDGLEIARTLQEATRTAGARSIEIIDLGLSIREVWELGLDEEERRWKNALPAALLEHLDEDESNWLCSGRELIKSKYYYVGKRVELNAFTSDKFVEWLSGKLAAHGLTEKVIPPHEHVRDFLSGRVKQGLSESIEENIIDLLFKTLGTTRSAIGSELRAELEEELDGLDCYEELKDDLGLNPLDPWDEYCTDYAVKAVGNLMKSDSVEAKIRQIVQKVVNN